jgi:hypothetical protein
LRNAPGGVIALPGSPVPITSTYTYAEFAGCNREVHAGVQVVARSGVLHELDVGVFRADACARGRAGRRFCSHHAELGIEAKCYDGSLGLHVGRSVLGLNSDTYCPIRLVTNAWDPKVNRMLIARTRNSRLLPSVRPARPAVEAWTVRTLAALI